MPARGDPMHTGSLSYRPPKSKLCDAWREAIKAKNVQNLSCSCERAHSIEELQPPTSHRRHDPGAFIDVWDLGDTGVVKTYPSQQVYSSKGSEGYFNEVYTRRRPPPRVLHCYNYLKYGKCDNWEECKYIHVYNPRFEGPFPGPLTAPTNSTSFMPSPNASSMGPGPSRNVIERRRQEFPKAVLCSTAKDGQSSTCLCPLAHSFAELVEPPSHVRCIPGYTINVETADKLDKADYPSDQVYATYGANKYLSQLEQTGHCYPAIHCTTYVQYGKCSFWESCHYIHVASSRANQDQLVEAQRAYNIRQQQLRVNPTEGGIPNSNNAVNRMEGNPSVGNVINEQQPPQQQPGSAIMPSQWGRNTGPTTVAPQTQAPTPSYGNNTGSPMKSSLCPNWKVGQGDGCPCAMAHGYDQLEAPFDHVLLAQGQFMRVTDPVYGTTTYPSQQVYQTKGAQQILSGMLNNGTHCRDFLKYGKCELWTSCPYIHVWRAS